MSEQSSMRSNGAEPGVTASLSAAQTDVADAESHVRDAAARFVHEARATLEEVTEDLLAKARVSYGAMRAQAKHRGEQTVTAVRERPGLALAAAVGVGFLIGHLMSSHRTQVIYLRDAR